MEKLSLKDVQDYVENNIGSFHDKRISKLTELKLDHFVKRKNPYLYKAKNLKSSEQIIKSVVDAGLSSSEETDFGNWLEDLAIFINKKVYGGRKSGITGIDLEFDDQNKRYIVSIKSGPNWGNSSSLAKLKSNFKEAKRIIRGSSSKIEVVAVIGICYGKDKKPDKGDYYRYCGQRFWEFISNEPTLYQDIIVPLGYKAKEKNDAIDELYYKVINRFTKEFSEKFCDNEGSINWQELLRYNSSSD